MTQALGMIETLGIANSIIVADAMLKAADVRLVCQEEVGQAYYTILIEGDISAVQMAIEQGTALAQDAGTIIAFDIIPRPVEGTLKIVGYK